MSTAQVATSQGAQGTTHRYWEVDLARTLAIAMMVVYHAGYDVDFLAPSVGIDALGGGWRALQVATGSTFLVVAGVSFQLSDAAATRRGFGWTARARKHARRGALVVGWGLVISVVTRIALGDDYVRFGILHAIGTAIVLAPLLARLERWNLLAGPAVILAGLAIKGSVSDVPGAVVLGWEPSGGAGVDHYPLMPWLGLFMIGLAIGALLYPDGRPGVWASRLPAPPPRWLMWPGRHSLAIYLVHQILLIAVIAGILEAAGVDWSWPD